MGICSSCEATAVVEFTAKLIMPDGRLQEYAGKPVRVSQVLQKETGCFICSADDMEFDGYVSALGAVEELEPGEIYFALPVSMLRRRLNAEDMAALAVRASSTLVKSGAIAVGMAADQYVSKRRVVAPSKGCGGEKGLEVRRWRKGSGGRGRDFSPELSAIPE